MNEASKPTDRFAALAVSYVSGALAGAEARQFEQHVTTCQSCARRLEEEARLEMQLHEVGASAAAADARRAAPLAMSPRVWPRRGLLAAGLAVTLAVALYTSRPRPAGEGAADAQAVLPSRAPFAITCLDDAQRAACIEDAGRHGLRIDYPPALAEIPRYEEMGIGHGSGGPRLRQAQLAFD